MISYRTYLDNVFEQLPMMDKASKPPRYIIYTPVLFEAWYEWYDKLPDRDYSPKTENADQMKPMGERVAPEWVKDEFKSLEDFYKHYTWLMSEPVTTEES